MVVILRPISPDVAMPISRAELARACDLALADDAEAAMAIVQSDTEDHTAAWIRAVLYKMEGDVSHARLWYGRAGQFFESYPEPSLELRAIKASLTY
jgi:hypothetical protein